MADFQPRGAGQVLTVTISARFAFRTVNNVGTPVRMISGLNCLMTLSPNFLRLARHVTMPYSRFAIGGAATPYQVGVPPTKCCALAGRTNSSRITMKLSIKRYGGSETVAIVILSDKLTN